VSRLLYTKLERTENESAVVYFRTLGMDNTGALTDSKQEPLEYVKNVTAWANPLGRHSSTLIRR